MFTTVKMILFQLASELQSARVCNSVLMQELRDIFRGCRFYGSAAVLAFEDYQIIMNVKICKI